MTSERLAGSEDAAKRLSATSLREFLDPKTDKDETRRYRRYRRPVSRDEIALPGLARYALKLVGLPSAGPGEKVAWWVNFLFQGRQCELALEKFGLRLYVELVDNDETKASQVANKIVKKLSSSMRAVESWWILTIVATLGSWAWVFGSLYFGSPSANALGRRIRKW